LDAEQADSAPPHLISFFVTFCMCVSLSYPQQHTNAVKGKIIKRLKVDHWYSNGHCDWDFCDALRLSRQNL
jgi:hypothetical protein